MSTDGWSPEAYGRFTAQRTAPFDDLLRLVTPAPGGALLDLGCGTGQLTARAHRQLGTATALGVDSSAAMLAADAPREAGLTLAQRDIATDLPQRTFERVISNSALNWIDDHSHYLPRVLRLVAPGGELAIQMPSNPGSPFSRCALAAAERFSPELGGFRYRSPVEEPERYAELLARDERVAESKVGTWYYPQLHESVDGLVAFAQGGLLTGYRHRLSAADFERFCRAYRDELQAAHGPGPVFFAFRRVFLWARLRAPA
jgi:trans-aconitate 2-methyltransferase